MTKKNSAEPCMYCGGPAHRHLCYRISEIEYHGDGSVKRVKLWSAADMPFPRQQA